ncbi:prepilin peptidase [Cellulomonas bogoriensis]|uniref:Prepilin leader peptidase/N-methyltransferase n=1 Tax=Cellulomonas bogoriensis 69B4 = DSM 16987 TaxID=1386082 RepID=A0A0A0C2R8_9CELL|nr:A24 family peptidase [Cellulomonas bogoriensis]KGM14257.1 peptidase A24 [Cellulomonas bogoriensis 69B4 = DSM 16987]
MEVLVYVLVGVVGLAIGSFLNVVIWRVPRDRSVVRPRSSCPGCDAEIAPRDNVPVLSWLLLKGRCRHCGARIPVRYPLVELATALAFVALTWGLGFRPDLPAYLYLAAVSIALAMIDLDVHRLPDKIVLPSYVVAVVALSAAALTTSGIGSLLRAAAAGAILFIAYFALAMAYPKGMGFGDVKLAGLLGLYLGWVGWGAVVIGAFSAFLLGGLFSIGLILARRAGRKSGIPFGPWMLAGAWLGLTVGETLWRAYLDLVL